MKKEYDFSKGKRGAALDINALLIEAERLRGELAEANKQLTQLEKVRKAAQVFCHWYYTDDNQECSPIDDLADALAALKSESTRFYVVERNAPHRCSSVVKERKDALPKPR